MKQAVRDQKVAVDLIKFSLCGGEPRDLTDMILGRLKPVLIGAYQGRERDRSLRAKPHAAFDPNGMIMADGVKFAQPIPVQHLTIDGQRSGQGKPKEDQAIAGSSLGGRSQQSRYQCAGQSCTEPLP